MKSIIAFFAFIGFIIVALIIISIILRIYGDLKTPTIYVNPWEDLIGKKISEWKNLKTLSLGFNKLTTLPPEVREWKQLETLKLSHNKLTSLPESIGNLKVNGSFSCYNNRLTSLPESIGNLKLNGYFNCSNNQLTSDHPVPQKLVEGIYDDYCYLDGILTDKISQKSLDNKTVIKYSFGYIVSDGTHHAHGIDLRTALLDLHFKTSEKDLTKYKSLDLNSKRSLEELYEIYRNVTGACSFGTNMWMSQNDDFVKKVETEGASINEILIKTKGQYGNEKLTEFFS